MYLLNAFNQDNLLVTTLTTITGIILGGFFSRWIAGQSGPKQSRFKSLAGYYFASYIQGQRTDKCGLIINVSGRKRITGIIKVRYQKPDCTYDNRLEELIVSGEFLYDTLLLLNYYNSDLRKKQAGTLMLDYESSGNLKGYFTAYFMPVPSDRDQPQGQINFNSCTPKEFETFLI